jgi:hypothetical protein
MKVNTFLLIAAIVYGLFGLGALLAPAQLFASMGLTLDASGQLVARTGAAAGIGYAVIFWLARGAETSPALRAILLGNVVYLILEIIVIVLAALSAGTIVAALPGIIVDGLLGVGFAYYSFKS